MPDYAYESLPVFVRKRDAAEDPAEGAGVYEFGVVMDGVFVAFAGRKAGSIDLDIKAAKEQAKDSQQSSTTTTSAETTASDTTTT